jgi:hypothetical protein
MDVYNDVPVHIGMCVMLCTDLVTRHWSILQETLNFWKQLEHVMKYFRAEEDPTARLPKNFISGFLEVGH